MRRACFAFLVAASVTPPTGLLAQAKSDTVPLAERAWVAGKLYSAVQRYTTKDMALDALELANAVWGPSQVRNRCSILFLSPDCPSVQ